MKRYSLFALARDALFGAAPTPAWRDAAPRSSYDAIVVGGGGHGLATAYYLAREHGLRDVAVLEKSHVGSGNAGRNTTIIRSNYLLPENIDFYDFSMKLWERMERDLNFNTMVSQRGVLELFHSDGQRDAFVRRGNAMRMRGVDAELLDVAATRRLAPYVDFDNARFPVLGAMLHRRGGTARHDAVVWGHARAADALGVDIVQNCEVTGIRVERGRAAGVETTRGFVRAKRIGLAVAGHSSRLAAMAGVRLPVESHVLQAFVTEGLKPLVHHVVMFGAGHFYVSQSDKGGLVFGGGIDGYNSYARRGNLPVVEDVCEAGVAMMPALSRLRVLRHWGGAQDMTMDGSPIIDFSPVEGLFLNCGWGYTGFKATPASGFCFAHLMARGEPHPLAAPFRLDRFAAGRVLDEEGRGARANLQ